MEIQKVSIPATEYEALVRDSERMSILKDFIKKGKYITIDDVKSILGISEREGDQNDGN